MVIEAFRHCLDLIWNDTYKLLFNVTKLPLKPWPYIKTVQHGPQLA